MSLYSERVAFGLKAHLSPTLLVGHRFMPGPEQLPRKMDIRVMALYDVSMGKRV